MAEQSGDIAAANTLKVFLSYSHDSAEHRDRVLGLSTRLRDDGFETRLDQYMAGGPPEGWPRWMLNQLDEVDWVLVVCTPRYYKRFRGHELPGAGRGVDWEGALITQQVYDSRSRGARFVPVFISTDEPDCIPEPLRAGNHYTAHTQAGYDALKDHLLGQAGVAPNPVGALQRKTPAAPRPLVLQAGGAAPPPLPPDTSARAKPPVTALFAAAVGAVVLVGAVLLVGAVWTREPFSNGGDSSHADRPPPVAFAAGSAVANGFKTDLDLRFTANPLLAAHGAATEVRMKFNIPDRKGPFSFERNAAGDAAQFLHEGFDFPPPQANLGGTVQRAAYGGVAVTASTVPLLKTPLCLRVVKARPAGAPPLRLDCTEGDGCRPVDPAGAVVACDSPGSSRLPVWLDWLPSAQAQPAKTPAAASAGTPAASAMATADADAIAAGDWVVPTLDTLRQRLKGNDPAAFSEFTVTLDAPNAPVGTDAAGYELTINGKRLWVDAMPAWVYAQPWSPGQPLTLAFGIENLNASGAERGVERLDLRVVYFQRKHPVADEPLQLPYLALRDTAPVQTTTDRQRSLRWQVHYRPASGDQYQILAHGGGVRSTLQARDSLLNAHLPAPGESAGPAGQRLVGLVRPPIPGNPSWAISLGQTLPSGQLRFSFDADAARRMCRWVMDDARARRIAALGLKPPATWGVRVIAEQGELDRRPKHPVPCSRFSAT
jgi:hypothetical protein